MTTTAKAEKPEIKLSCREAHLILRVIPLRKNVSEMKEEEIASIKHYIHCKDCRDRGLADVLDTQLSCKEANLVWAERASALWLDCSSMFGPRVETIIELYATEHVWGRYQWKNSMGGHGWDIGTGCREHSCQALHSYWASIPMSSGAGDGPGGVIQLFPFLFETFLEEKWPLDELLAVQKKRIAALLEDIKSGIVTVSTGHYSCTYELLEEIQEHIAVLQKLAVRPMVSVAPA
ncbi:MAG: hypothetical protein Q8P33_03455 [bacterium]|nr:hypothetical protein [bacterium]